MQELAYTDPSRQQSFSAGSRPSPSRFFSLTLFATLAALCLYVLAGVALQAQTAHLGKIVTLGSGFANPFTVAVDANGNVAVIDYGNHAVKEILAAGGYTTVRTLASDLSFMFGSAFDSHGNLFFTEYGKNHVDEMLAVNGVIPPSPKIVILGSGFNIPAGVAVDASGNIFIGDQNNNAVKEILASSGYATTITVATGFSTPDGVAVDKYGNVFVANDGGNSVEEIEAVNGVIPPSPTIITLGSGFLQPFDVAVDGGGNVYVADRGNNAVKEILAVNGVIPASPTILTLGSGFATPTGVTVDSSGNVYVADNGNSAVKEIQKTGPNFGQVTVGTAAAAIPVTFTFDTAGTLGSYAVVTLGDAGLDFYDAGGGTCVANGSYTAGQTCTVNVGFSPFAPGPRFGSVKLLSTTGTLVASGPLQGIGGGPQATFAVTTSGVSVPSSSVNAGSGFRSPGGAAVDASGNIFIADSDNGAVKEIMAAGGWTTVKSLGSGFGFDYPNGLAIDGGGNVYVADTLNDAVEEIVATGGYTTVNSVGRGFSNPYAVAVDGSGNVFVANYSPGTVQEMQAVSGSIPASPSILTLASGLNGPDGVAVDGNGNVFVAVYGDGTVLEIHAVNGSVPASPVITTIANGFSGPSNLSVDGAGNVFVSDTDDGKAVELVAAGGYTTHMVLGGTFSAPEATAVWQNGDVIVADAASNQVSVLEYANAPALAFATTLAGSTSSDSPQTVTVSNDGNAPLSFPLPGSGTNPSIPANFAWDNSSTCLETTPASSQAFALAGGTSCTMALDFKPMAVGSFNSPAVLTDNNLNVPNSTQSIQLTGTGTATPPSLTSPSASPVSGSTSFIWSPGFGWVHYELIIGNTGVGSSNIYNSGATASNVTSETVNIPSNGVTLFVRLYYEGSNLVWNYKDYTFTEGGTPTPPALTSPTSSPVSGSTQFIWSPGIGWAHYELLIGTTGAGSSNIFNSGALASTVTAETVNIPSNGVALYVRLLYEGYNWVWNYTDYAFTEIGTQTPPSLISPSASTVSGSTSFTWSPGIGWAHYELRIGTAGPGTSDVYYSGVLAANATSKTVTIPSNGKKLYVRIYYEGYNWVWNYKDYTFAEAP